MTAPAEHGDTLHLTEHEHDALWAALRTARHEDAPVPLLSDGHRFHVLHMLAPAVERILADRLSARSAATEQHGYGTDSDCVCGRNFATVRGLREHLTKHRLAVASPSLDPSAWGCDHHAEPATCLSVGEPEERCCRVCRRVAADRLMRAITRDQADQDARQGDG